MKIPRYKMQETNKSQYTNSNIQTYIFEMFGYCNLIIVCNLFLVSWLFHDKHIIL